SVTAVSAVEPVDDDTRFRTGSRSDRIPSRVVSFMQPDERDPATAKRDSTKRRKDSAAPASDRKTISEVLHDIYDEHTG
ncbi:MAG: hypothetical protein KBD94_00140, partial [Pyrinomonadaceae bacterium]|nr:hypothetical protein [Pyrinomonadaceae bacterium]